MKIKKILVSQPKPELERSPYFEIARNFNVEMVFRPFVQVEGIPAREFRKHRVDILSYTAVIMTSKNAVDHFFRICTEMRIIVPETMKYFCISEATAYYLQKYIQFRKRKIFFSNYSYADLVDLIKKKHSTDKFLLPCSDAPNEEYTSLLTGLKYAKAPLYRAVMSDLTDINFSEYDMVVLFSSAGIASLLKSFPEYKQNNTVIAAFGEQTAKAITDAGLKIHLIAPQAQAPSMATALELYLKGALDLNNQKFLEVQKPAGKGSKARRGKNEASIKGMPSQHHDKPAPKKAPVIHKTEPKMPEAKHTVTKKPEAPKIETKKPEIRKHEVKKTVEKKPIIKQQALKNPNLKKPANKPAAKKKTEPKKVAKKVTANNVKSKKHHSPAKSKKNSSRPRAKGKK